MSPPSFLQSTSLLDLRRLIDLVSATCPPLADRSTKAGTLLMAGRVTPLRPDAFEVRGSASEPYTVDLLAETCSRPDFQHRAPEFKGSRWCKHLLGALMFGQQAKRSVRRGARRLGRLRTYRVKRSRRPIHRSAIAA